MQADDVSLVYGGQVVLEDAGFSIQKGERCGLIGRNGSGKSTLFRLIAGDEVPDKGSIVMPKGYRLGILQQHIRFTKPTVLEEAALGLRDPDELYRVESLLFGLGFDKDSIEEPPEKFSGGYQLRIQLAKVLASDPDCLLLDEPTNYLDILSIRFLSKFLQQWKGEMILISHDLEFLDEATTHMMAIHRHKIEKIKGKSADLFHLIAEKEERHEVTRVNLEKKKAHLEGFIERFGAKATKASQAQSKKKLLDKLPDLEKLKNLAHLDFNFHEVPFNGKKMMEASHLRFAYDAPLIQDVSFSIEKGDRIAIIGKNGYGKSTLLRLLSQDLAPQGGTLTTSVTTRIGYFGQTNIDRLRPKLRIEEEISDANHKLNFTQVRSICGLMMFSGDAAKKTISVLSGGEKSRVLLGKIIAQPCNLLLLDEPTHHLDIESIEALIDAIEEFEGAVVIVTHSERILRRLPFNKLIVCHKEKQELFPDSYDEFLAKVGWQEEGKKAPDKAKPASPPPKKSSNKWAVKNCEDQIMQLEESILKNNQKLEEASQKGDGPEIKKLLSLIEQEQKQIDALFKKLEELS
ncbi:MAG: ATP-binding cassette domain-containing protein [Parachlamydiales bacterium]|nr:ATP-binding cassette domain-containing protein [Parachlamydiales bacterium]